MLSSSTPSPALPSPDANAARPVPPINERPAWVVPCPDLDAAVTEVGAAGFSLLAIGPADDPRWALMGRSGATFSTLLRLDTQAYGAGHRHPFLEVGPGDPRPIPSDAGGLPEFVVADRNLVTTFDPAEADPPAPTELGATTPNWIVGRAGMRYRDLLPGRWGGQFIASHIHIPDGGPVPDYVHYHHVDFQLIFCHRGWVRVVYQDQGEPFVLEPGDAVLQAPGIRHRVLEASDDLQVIEVSSPAEHATFAEHDLELPNGSEPGRWYGGQRYVHHRAVDSPWTERGAGIAVQSLELEPATGDRYGAAVVELDAVAGATLALPVVNSVDFEFVTVLDGAVTVDDATTGRRTTLEAGAAFGSDGSAAWTARPEGPTRLLAVGRHHA